MALEGSLPINKDRLEKKGKKATSDGRCARKKRSLTHFCPTDKK